MGKTYFCQDKYELTLGKYDTQELLSIMGLESNVKITNRRTIKNSLFSEDKKTIYHEFCRIDDIYIADGHHRAASAVKVGFKRREEKGNYTGDEEFNFFLSVLFPDEELMIMPYNRVVKDLNGRSKEAFLEEIRNRFDIEKKDAQVRDFIMCIFKGSNYYSANDLAAVSELVTGINSMTRTDRMTVEAENLLKQKKYESALHIYFDILNNMEDRKSVV